MSASDLAIVAVLIHSHTVTTGLLVSHTRSANAA
jgi:hypothetical protein